MDFCILFTSYLSFEIAYGFNQFSWLDLPPLLVNEIASLDEKQKADFWSRLIRKHESRFCKRMKELLSMRTKEERKLPSKQERVWVHFQNEWFPNHRKSKLDRRSDGTFEIFEKFNDNAYKIYFPNKYHANPTFNIFYLSPYAEPDSRKNPFKKGGMIESWLQLLMKKSQVKFQKGVEQLLDSGWKLRMSLSNDSPKNYVKTSYARKG